MTAAHGPITRRAAALAAALGLALAACDGGGGAAAADAPADASPDAPGVPDGTLDGQPVTDAAPDGLADTAPDPGPAPDSAAPPPDTGPAPTCAGAPETCAPVALARVNAYRAAAGAPPLALAPPLTQAAQAHCDYFLAHYDEVYAKLGTSPHDELPGYDGFTGVSFGQRAVAAGYAGFPLTEVMTFANDPALAVDAWMVSLYHRVPFLLPRVDDMGYGGGAEGGHECDVVDLGVGGPPPAGSEASVVVFPPDGATGVPSRWYGQELPKPPLPGPYPSGPILTVTFGAGDNGVPITLTATALAGPDGDVPHVASAPGQDPNLCCSTVALYAHEPLAPGATYTATVAATVDGTPRSVTWSFTTHPSQAVPYYQP